MRDIKFRAWFKEELEMRNVAINNVYEGNKTYLYLSPMPMSDYKAINLMQYTGLNDKNEKEIYEGDIFEFGYIVTFVDSSDEANLGLNCGWYQQRDDFESYAQLEVGEEYEVLGNIYENPELLKGE